MWAVGIDAVHGSGKARGGSIPAVFNPADSTWQCHPEWDESAARNVKLFLTRP